MNAVKPFQPGKRAVEKIMTFIPMMSVHKLLITIVYDIQRI